jgi:hypothetical protein
VELGSSVAPAGLAIREAYRMTEVDLSLWIVLAGLVVALGSFLILLR